MDTSVMPDDLLEMIGEREPQIPICTAECVAWSLEHKDCQGCQHWPMCGSFIVGLEIGAKRYGIESMIKCLRDRFMRLED